MWACDCSASTPEIPRSPTVTTRSQTRPPLTRTSPLTAGSHKPPARHGARISARTRIPHDASSAGSAITRYPRVGRSSGHQ